ncbi:MAG: hypothetical protein ACK56F_16850, partial [bacterium]
MRLLHRSPDAHHRTRPLDVAKHPLPASVALHDACEVIAIVVGEPRGPVRRIGRSGIARGLEPGGEIAVAIADRPHRINKFREERREGHRRITLDAKD